MYDRCVECCFVIVDILNDEGVGVGSLYLEIGGVFKCCFFVNGIYIRWCFICYVFKVDLFWVFKV